MSFSEETQQFIDHYLKQLGQDKMNPAVFFGFLAILIVIFTVRFFILFGIEKRKTKRKYDLKHAMIYIMSHTSTEFFIALFVCFVLVKLTGGNLTNYILNFVLFPVLGTLLGVYVDNKIFIPIETATGFGSKLMKSGSKEKEKKDNNGNNITININGDKKEEKAEVAQVGILSNEYRSLLDDSLADSDEFNTTIIEAINEIKNENATQNNIINSNTKKLDRTIESLNVLKESEMINKKIELKSLIYTCLNQGFATPEQNDKITLLYTSYEALGGNHEIKSLYYEHYLKLPVHDDMAIVNSYPYVSTEPIANANRESADAVYTIYDRNTNTGNLAMQNLNTPTRLKKRLYNYGEFDNVDE